MNQNTKLAAEVEKQFNASLKKVPELANGEPIYSAASIEMVIDEHQSSYPGSWQGWTVEGMTPIMLKLIRKAAKAGEVWPARIVLL